MNMSDNFFETYVDIEYFWKDRRLYTHHLCIRIEICGWIYNNYAQKIK